MTQLQHCAMTGLILALCTGLLGGVALCTGLLGGVAGWLGHAWWQRQQRQWYVEVAAPVTRAHTQRWMDSQWSIWETDTQGKIRRILGVDTSGNLDLGTVAAWPPRCEEEKRR